LAAASSGKKAARRAARGEGGGGAVAFEGGGGTLEAGPFFSFPGVDDGATARRRSVFDECEAKKRFFGEVSVGKEGRRASEQRRMPHPYFLSINGINCYSLHRDALKTFVALRSVCFRTVGRRDEPAIL
jgi:hypothetical protein